MEFDVVGGDDRVRDLHLQVVDRPELYAIELECVYPEYLAREPRRLPVTGGMRIPEGTKLVLHATSTKPLTAAHVHGSKDKQDTTHLESRATASSKAGWEYGTLTDDDVLSSASPIPMASPRASRIVCRSPLCRMTCRKWPCGSPASALRLRRTQCCPSSAK